MGNIPSPPPTSHYRESSSYHNIEYNRGKKYEPSQQQVDRAYEELMEAYQNFRCLWYGMDEELLLLKLLSRLREEHPELFIPAKNISNNDAAANTAIIESSSLPACEKKRMKVEDGPIIMNGLRIPREVIAHIVPYSDRLSINNLCLSCKGVYQIVHDSNLVKTIPWSMHCPWSRSHHGDRYNDNNRLRITSSRDWHRFAVCTARKYDDVEYYEDGPPSIYSHHVEIWDMFHGIIGELEWVGREYFPAKPMFSPDNQLMFAPLSVLSEDGEWHVLGVQAVQLPPLNDADKGPIIVSEHRFQDNLDVPLASLINNDTIAVMMESEDESDEENGGIDLWKIDRVDGQTALSFSRTVLEDVIDHYARYFTSFASESKTFLAFYRPRPRGNPSIVFHDLTTNDTLTKTLTFEGSITGMRFSQNGQLVVSFLKSQHQNDSGGLYVFNCKVTAIGEIADPRLICSSEDHGCWYYSDIKSFSADGTKVAAVAVRHGVNGTHIIDLQKGEVLLMGKSLEGMWDNPIFLNFVNCKCGDNA